MDEKMPLLLRKINDLNSRLTNVENKIDIIESNIHTIVINASKAGMPSDRYIDLTLGTSGTTYIAPADGYYTLVKASLAGEYISMSNRGTAPRDSLSTIAIRTAVGIIAGNSQVYIPCKKDDIIAVTYSATGTTLEFKFIYAEGINLNFIF